jgi:hypothetical protein
VLLRSGAAGDPEEHGFGEFDRNVFDGETAAYVDLYLASADQAPKIRELSTAHPPLAA